MLRTAINFMKFDKPKSIGIIVGIVISTFLIGQQIGTLHFITTAMSGLIDNSSPGSGDIWVISSATNNVNNLSNIDASLLQQIQSLPGVESTHGIVVTNGNLVMPNGGNLLVTLVGSRAPGFSGGPDPSRIIEGSQSDLIPSKTISSEYFNSTSLSEPLSVGTEVEINGKRALVTVETKNAQSFGGSFTYSSMENARYYGNYPIDKVSIVQVQEKSGVDVDSLIQSINRSFTGIKAWKKGDLSSATVKELLISTNMGVSFGTLVVFAMVAGFFIIGLTLYSSALDRLKDYGVLKAIGAPNKYVRNLILLQALLFALIGYAIAVGLLFGFKSGVANSGLILQLGPVLLVGLLAITLFIAVGGAFFAVYRVNSVEPASVFR